MRSDGDGEKRLVVARRHHRLLPFRLTLRILLQEYLGEIKFALTFTVDVVPIESRRRRARHDALGDAVRLARVDHIQRPDVVHRVVHFALVIRPDERSNVPHALCTLTRLVDVVLGGQIALEPHDARVICRVFWLRSYVERHHALGTALDEHLDESTADEAHATGDDACFGYGRECFGRHCVRSSLAPRVLLE